MPIDASIYSNQQPPQRFNSPFQVLGQLGELQQQRQQIESNRALEEQRRIATEKAKREQDAAERFNAIIGNPQLTPQTFLEAVRTGAPEHYLAAQKSVDDAYKNAEDVKRIQAEAEAAQGRLKSAQQDYMGKSAQIVAGHNYDPAAFELMLKINEEAFPSAAPIMAKFREAAKAGGPEWIKQHISGLLPYADQKTAAEIPGADADTAMKQRILAGTGPTGITAQQQQQNTQAQQNAAEAARNNRAQEGISRASEARQAAGGPVQVMGPNGSPIWVRAADAIGQPAAQAARAVTGAERQSLAFYNRAKEAAETVTPLEEAIGKKSLAGQARLQAAPNWLQSAENQSYRQAQRAFTEARLRKESGAAIPTHEYENDSKTYFAQPGDTPTLLEQKRKARATVLNGLAFAAGKAYDEFYGEPRDNKSAAGAKADPLGIR